MNIYGGLSLGVASPVSKVSAEPASPSGMSGVAYSSGSTEKDSSSDGTHMPEYPSTVGGGYSEGYTAPKKEVDTTPKKEEDSGFYIPTFDDNGTPHWTEPDPPQSQGHLDVGKLLEGTHNEGYKLYSDGEGGFTQDPNSKGGIYYGENALAPKSTAPKSKKQTATAALPEVSQIYTMNGDDYSIDNTAFANAQAGTGDNQAAASIAGGSGGGGSKRNSNVNDAIFGGQSNKANPGYSLW